MRNYFCLILLMACLGLLGLSPIGTSWAQTSAIPHDERAAVIFSYHRVGKDENPADNIRLEQFMSHIAELDEADYNVIPLDDVIKSIKGGKKLPPRTIAITFDGGHRSILENAAPILMKYNFPFTIFVAPDNADNTDNDYLSWDEIKRLSKNDLVTIGIHPATYQRVGNMDATEIRRQINSAIASYRKNTGKMPAYFAYPFGEYSAEYRDIVASMGFKAAFGEQSGVAYAGSDLMTLPRFAMTETFGDLDRFMMTTRALPFPVSDVSPADPRLDTADPVIGFTVDESLVAQLKDLSCFAAGQGKPDIQIISKKRVEIRLEKAFTVDRARLNCLLPGPTPAAGDDKTWRWFGLMMTVPNTTQVWSNEDLTNREE
jgi:peptidoglycan/xylan/chitin deacetylase (PgdA/CDA1 family)